MSNELMKLYNTLMLVETKGESTKTMGTCLQFLENLIAKSQSDEKEKDINKIVDDKYED